MTERNLTRSRRCEQSCQSRAEGQRQRGRAPHTAAWWKPSMAVPGSASFGRVPQRGMPECQTGILQDPPERRGRDNWVRIDPKKQKAYLYKYAIVLLSIIKDLKGVLRAPRLCRAGRWHLPGSPWCHSGCRWWRYAANQPTSLYLSIWSSEILLKPGSAKSWSTHIHTHGCTYGHGKRDKNENLATIWNIFICFFSLSKINKSLYLDLEN